MCLHVVIMGQTASVQYEGYGTTCHEAVVALGHVLRYHHGKVTVHQRTERTLEGTRVVYFVFDGKEHPIFFTQSNGRIRAFVRE